MARVFDPTCKFGIAIRCGRRKSAGCPSSIFEGVLLGLSSRFRTKASHLNRIPIKYLLIYSKQPAIICLMLGERSFDASPCPPKPLRRRIPTSPPNPQFALTPSRPERSMRRVFPTRRSLLSPLFPLDTKNVGEGLRLYSSILYASLAYLSPFNKLRLVLHKTGRGAA